MPRRSMHRCLMQHRPMALLPSSSRPKRCASPCWASPWKGPASTWFVAIRSPPPTRCLRRSAHARASIWPGSSRFERLADALALAVQEDLVVMAGGAPHYVAPGDASPGDAAPKDAAPGAPVPGPVALEARVPDQRVPEDGRSDLLHVCFPSSWDPATRAGAGFIALHAPVPHNGSLRSAAGRVVRAMVTKGPFVRYVWSLAPDDALDRNPRRLATRPPPTDPARLWFRVERQTVMPLAASGRALFTIRVYRAPLPSVLTTPERSRTLASALRSMDAALLAYKGVGGLREALLAYLDGPSGA